MRAANSVVIRAVCFDVGGVMTTSVGEAFLRQANAAGLDHDAVKTAMWASFASPGDGDEPAHRLERGEIGLDEFFDLLGPVGPTARVLLDPESPYFVPAHFEADPAMHAFVHELHDRGVPMGIISNVIVGWEKWWDAVVPDHSLFEVVLYSCDIGLRKPAPAIYHLALDRLGVEPGETLYLDDFPAMVEAGRQLGLVSIHVTDHAAAIAEARGLLGFE